VPPCVRLGDLSVGVCIPVYPSAGGVRLSVRPLVYSIGLRSVSPHKHISDRSLRPAGVRIAPLSFTVGGLISAPVGPAEFVV